MNNLKIFSYPESVFNADIVFAVNAQKSADIICSSGAPDWRTVS
jgi:hypothetical protein